MVAWNSLQKHYKIVENLRSAFKIHKLFLEEV